MIDVTPQLVQAQIVHALNQGNGDFADDDYISFVVYLNDKPTIVVPPTSCGTPVGEVSPGGALSGNTLNLPDTKVTFTMSEGDTLTLIPIMACDSSSDPVARETQALATNLDIISATIAAAGAATAALLGPLGIAVGVFAAAIAAFFQIAKDCLGSTSSPRSGVVFNQALTYTYDQIKTHTVDGSQDQNTWYWTDELVYQSGDGSADTNLFLKVFRGSEYEQTITGDSGPGESVPALGTNPSNWVSPSGMWADANRRVICTVSAVSSLATTSNGASALHKILSFLSSPESVYRSGMDLSAFSPAAKRPVWQMNPSRFVGQNIDTLFESVTVKAQEGTATEKADLYSTSVSGLAATPMKASFYKGPRYAATTPDPSSDKTLRFAATLCLPDSVFLQLYKVYDKVNPSTIYRYQIRYLRYGNAFAVTDVMLDWYEPVF